MAHVKPLYIKFTRCATFLAHPDSCGFAKSHLLLIDSALGYGLVVRSLCLQFGFASLVMASQKSRTSREVLRDSFAAIVL
jgi:hypothetical protein